MVLLYCLVAFLAQFKHVLSFHLFGLYLDPARMSLILLVICDMILHKGKLKYQKKNSIWLLVLFLWNVWNVFSLAWAKDMMALLSTEIVMLEALAYVYYGQRLITSWDKLQKVMNSLTIAALIHNLWGWFEVTTSVYLFTSYSEKYTRHHFPVTTFTNTNNLAFYMALTIVILVCQAILTKNKLKKIGCTLLALSSAALLIQTQSRGAIIACLFGMGLFLLLMISNRKWIISGAVGITTAGFVAAFNTDLRNSVTTLLQKAFTLSINSVRGSDYVRLNMYANGLDFFLASFGLGVGVGNVEYWMQNYGTRNTDKIYNLHNWWLEILVSSGILVMLVVVLAWIINFVLLFRNYRSDRSDYRKRVVWSGAITFGIVFAIDCISPSTLFTAEWAWFLLALFFMIGSIAEQDKNHEGDANENSNSYIPQSIELRGRASGVRAGDRDSFSISGNRSRHSGLSESGNRKQTKSLELFLEERSGQKPDTTDLGSTDISEKKSLRPVSEESHDIPDIKAEAERFRKWNW